MAGKAGKSGRHKREEDVTPVLLRIPPALLARVQRCQARLQLQTGASVTRTAAFWHILEAGCAALEGTLEGRETPAPVHVSISEISEISNGTPMAYDDMLGFLGDEDEEETLALPVAVPQAAETPSSKAEPSVEQAPSSKAPAWNKLPREKLQAIADERTLCEGLSLTAFAKRLHDKGIHSSTAKDGSKVPVNKGRLARWLDEAREAGLL